MHVHEFHAINQLDVGASATVILGIDYNDTLQPADFDFVTSDRSFKAKVEAPVGEIITALTMTEKDFLSKQGKVL